MNYLIAVAAFAAAIGISVFLFPDGGAAVLVCVAAAALACLVINRFTPDELKTRRFLVKIFVVGLLFRVALAVVTSIFQLQEFFCVDAVAFDEAGAYLSSKWSDTPFYSNSRRSDLEALTNVTLSGWGISWLAAIFYYVLGRNPLAVQMFISVLGAATAVLVYVVSRQVYSNEQVARASAILVMIFPSMALWSSQILKDGVVIFFLVAALAIVLKLQEKFTSKYALLLLGCLAGISAFRFYLLLALIPALIAGFFIDPRKSFKYLAFRAGAIVAIAVGMSFMGFLGSIERSLDTSGYTLARLDQNREYLATAADSGFGADRDLSTPQGIAQAAGVGFVYLMFAPFPWTVTNLRQSVTMPEVLVWWSMIPFLIFGLWYTLRHRLRHAISIVLFLFILTGTYSLSQGNVGTAYRQRSQVQVFYFIFVAVGIVIWLERRENAKLITKARSQRHRTLRPS